MESTSSDMLASAMLLIPECSTAEEMKLHLNLLSHPCKAIQGKGIENHALLAYHTNSAGNGGEFISHDIYSAP